MADGRRQRLRFNFPLRPVWAEMTLTAVGCIVTIAAIWVANSYPWPPGVANAYAKDHNIPIPEGGLFIPTGVAIQSAQAGAAARPLRTKAAVASAIVRGIEAAAIIRRS